MRRLKVLVVTRSAEDRDLIRGFLKPADYWLFVAMNVEEALDQLRYNLGFDMVLADVSVQGPGSVEISTAIRSVNANIPVIGMTAFPIDWVLKQNGGLWVDGWLMKPFDREELEKVVWKGMTRVA